MAKKEVEMESPKVTVKATTTKAVHLFDKSNYILMAVGLVLIIIGYLLMMGGKSDDPNVFKYDEIYSFTRITLAPILVLAGFIVEIYAIMKRPGQMSTGTAS